MPEPPFKVVYSDIGGVLGTNGWDGSLRARICSHFQVPASEIEPRHRLLFDSFERGYMKFEEYLRRVFFASARAFTVDDVRAYAYSASIAWQENIEFFRTVKAKNNVKLALISNEGEGLTQHRIEKFGLRQLADFVVISHFVHFRKPDPEIWLLALDLAQARPEECLYIDDREVFVSAATELGFTAIRHSSLQQTRAQLQMLGLQTE
jgi:putative hydrolase of the HAD superfamily